ncbi:MAG: hypothetical protein ACOCTP_03765 [Roseicyclus sp.]
MRLIPCLFAAFLSLLPPSAAADTGRLSEMLRMIPDSAIPRGTPRIDIAYGNGDAVRAVARGGNPAWPADDWAHEHAAMRAATPAQAAALLAGGGQAMSLSWRDWVHTLEVVAPPVRLGVHFLFPDSEMRLRGALFGAGFAPATRNGQMVLWSGRGDHEPDAARVDPSNPFGGAEGLATRHIVEGEWALWATGWPQIEAMQAPFGPSLGDRPEVMQTLGALEGSVRRYGRLVSARIAVDLSGQGLPDWPDMGLSAVVLADVVDRREEAALLAMFFAPGTDPQAVAARIAERWGGTMLARWGAAPTLVAVAGQRPGLILAIEGDWGEDEARSNDALASLLRARENGTLAALVAP